MPSGELFPDRLRCSSQLVGLCHLALERFNASVEIDVVIESSPHAENLAKRAHTFGRSQEDSEHTGCETHRREHKVFEAIDGELELEDSEMAGQCESTCLGTDDDGAPLPAHAGIMKRGTRPCKPDFVGCPGQRKQIEASALY